MPSRAPSSVDLPEPLGPTSATRSPAPIVRSIGPSVKCRSGVTRSTTRPVKRATTSPERAAAGNVEAQLPRLAGLVDHLEALHRAFGACRAAGELLGLVDGEVADVLVGLVRVGFALREALRRPLPLPLGASGETGALGVVVLEALPRQASAAARSSRYACQPPPNGVARWVNSSISTTSVTVRARNVRSWLTSTTAPDTPPIHRSRRARPSRSRSLVGSSSRKTSKRASSSAASPARAASPPESVRVGWSSTAGARPRSAHTSPTRASRSAAPRASQRCRAVS